MENIVIYFLWNKKYFEEISKINNSLNIIYIDTYKWDFSNSVSKIVEDFHKKYVKWKKIYIISLWKVSVSNNLKHISESLDEIKNIYAIDRENIIWSLSSEVETFNNKIPTLEKINSYWLKPIKFQYIKELSDFSKFKYPLVLKSDWLTWWCWMKYIKDQYYGREEFIKFKDKWLKNIFISDFLEWIEISFSVFRLWGNFIRLPISFRESSDKELTHPDEKIKITWFIWGFEDFFSKIEKMMISEWIYWPFYLEWIFKDNEIYFLEWWTRLSWSTPIRLKSLKKYNLFKEIINYICWDNVNHPLEYSISVQYWHYIDNKNILNYNKLKNICFSLKKENTSLLPFSEKNLERIRINYNSENLSEIIEKSKKLGILMWIDKFDIRIKKFSFDLIKNFSSLGYVPSPICKVLNNVDKSSFYISSTLPDKELVTATFLVLINEKKQILLIDNNDRWLWLPWWHIEKWETIEDALIREVYEESWLKVKDLELLWFNKIFNNSSDWKYPSPLSYITYYIDRYISTDNHNLDSRLHFYSLRDLQLLDNSSKEILIYLLEYLEDEK